MTPEVRAALLAALDRLAGAGWQIRELTAPWLGQLRSWEDTLAVIVAREASQVHRGRDQTRYADGTRALLAYGAGVSDQEYAAALRRRAELTAAIDASLAGVAALAGPTVGYPAPEQDPPFGTDADHGEGRFTGPYNLTGHPAVSLPVPAAGLPAGLQLAGRRGGDVALLRLAAAAERCWPATNPDDRPKEPAPMPTTVSYRTLDLAGAGVPVIELTGAQDGPRLIVLAGVHGCEYAPMAAVRQWARELGGPGAARPRDRGAGAEPARVPVPHPVRDPGRRQEPQPLLPGRPGRHVHRPAGRRGVPAS